MGYFEHDFEIGLRDVENPNYLSNKAILAFLKILVLTILIVLILD